MHVTKRFGLADALNGSQLVTAFLDQFSPSSAKIYIWEVQNEHNKQNVIKHNGQFLKHNRLRPKV